MNKILTLLLLASCGAYGMEEKEPNLKPGTEVFIQTCANILKESDPNLSQKEVVNHLRKIVPSKTCLLRVNYVPFTKSIIFELKDLNPDYIARRSACNQALKKLTNEEFAELREQQ